MKQAGIFAFGLIAGAAIVYGAITFHGSDHKPYTGQQARSVTTLSDADIADLQAGRGWGLAKPAELNGYPGPRHVLDEAEALALSPSQRGKVQAVFAEMAANARHLGARYIEAERQLDLSFRDRIVDHQKLTDLLAQTEAARASLREVHLAAHLKIAPVLTPDQKRNYAELRGYSEDGSHSH